MAGTASRVTRWLAVEQPGSWGRNALLESRLDEQIARSLQSAARRHGVRVLLIRRPGWRKPEDGRRRVYLARTRTDGSWIEQLDLDDGLAGLDLEVFDSPTPPGVGRPGPPSVHLVCTNGRHDACCADQGRPVVRALDETDVPEVWESSHVGGDRFAANVVCLPSGVFFGRVAADEAAPLLHEHADGVLRLERYRGRSCFDSMVQAGEVFVRRHLGERRLDALRVVDVDRLDADVRRVRFEHSAGGAGPAEVGVVVERRRAPDRLLSCGHAPSPPWTYRQVGDIV